MVHVACQKAAASNQRNTPLAEEYVLKMISTSTVLRIMIVSDVNSSFTVVCVYIMICS